MKTFMFPVCGRGGSVNQEVYQIFYNINDSLSFQQEKYLLEFINPYVSSVTYNIDTNKLCGFGIYRHLHFWYQLAIAYALEPDKENE